MASLPLATAEVCDANTHLITNGELRALHPIFQIYGRRQVFSGPIVTLKVFEDNVLIREFLEEKGCGRVLVVDGGGSMRCAILGGNTVQHAQNNGWAGIVVNGCIRDVDEINGCDIGVRALASHPMKANKKGIGEKQVAVSFAGTRVCDVLSCTDFAVVRLRITFELWVIIAWNSLKSNHRSNLQFYKFQKETDMASLPWATAEVCGASIHLLTNGELRALHPIFQIYGRRQAFSGPIVTLKVLEDNVLIREFLEEKGYGRVLVVDGGGSMRCAILGGNTVQHAHNNGWAGIVVNGCIRDVDEINACDIGVRALASHPMKANRRGIGQKQVAVSFAGTRVCDGEWLYADTDGVLVSKTELSV